MDHSKDNSNKSFGLKGAISLIVTSMVGTGIFTSLGFQVDGISSNFHIILIWVIGAILALCGAIVYAQLGLIFKESGGEYIYLSKTYSNFVGFCTGMISSFVAFPAPIAAAAIAFSSYLLSPFNLNNDLLLEGIGILAFLILIIINIKSIKNGIYMNNLFALFKIVVLLFIILLANSSNEPIIESSDNNIVEYSSIIISLYYVTYAFSGWNSSAYVYEEIKKPEKNLPKSLILGTLIVSVIYILFNYSILTLIPKEVISKKIELLHLTTQYLYPKNEYLKYTGIIIALFLLSSMNSMLVSGSRIIKKFIDNTSKKNMNINHIFWLQLVIVIIYIITYSFEQLIIYMSFLMNLSLLLAVLSIFFVDTSNVKKLFPIKLIYFCAFIYALIMIPLLFFGIYLRSHETIFSTFIFLAISYFLFKKFQHVKTS